MNDKVIKAILSYIAKEADGKNYLKVPNGDDLKSKFSITDIEVAYHVNICIEAGFIKAVHLDQEPESSILPAYKMAYLTYKGQMLLAHLIRGNTLISWPGVGL